MKYIKLNTEDQMPIIGLGTYNAKQGEIYQAIRWALKLGYKHFDCADIYNNQSEIGQAITDAIAEDNLQRKDIFITSKLWNDSHNPQDVIPSLKNTLKQLKTDYLDLWLMHWPIAQKKGTILPDSNEDMISLSELPLTLTYQEMEKAQKQGLVKAIGVSNFGKKNLQTLIDNCEIVPAVNQVELHPYLQQTELVDFCNKNMIAITAYSPLGSGHHTDKPNLLEDTTIKEISHKLKITPAQVILSWHINQGICVIPKSVHENRLRENMAAINIFLDNDDMKKIAELDRNYRYTNGNVFAYKDYSAEQIFA